MVYFLFDSQYNSITEVECQALFSIKLFIRRRRWRTWRIQWIIACWIQRWKPTVSGRLLQAWTSPRLKTGDSCQFLPHGRLEGRSDPKHHCFYVPTSTQWYSYCKSTSDRDIFRCPLQSGARWKADARRANAFERIMLCLYDTKFIPFRSFGFYTAEETLFPAETTFHFQRAIHIIQLSS